MAFIAIVWNSRRERRALWRNLHGCITEDRIGIHQERKKIDWTQREFSFAMSAVHHVCWGQWLFRMAAQGAQNLHNYVFSDFLRPEGLLIYESSKSLSKWLKLLSRCAEIIQKANSIFTGCFAITGNNRSFVGNKIGLELSTKIFLGFFK